MKHRIALFLKRKLYNLPPTDGLFARAIKEHAEHHNRRCPEYREILESLHFSPDSLRGIEDIAKLPPLPVSYLKRANLLSKSKLLIPTTSSGTGGIKTMSGFDFSSALCALAMVFTVFRFHRLLSLRRTNYIILGYRPDKINQTAMAKALKGVTLLAPAKEIAYALTVSNGEYRVNTEELIDALLRYSRQNRPVRIIGLPVYFKLLLDELNKRGVKLRLHKQSKVLLGGGWKSFFAEEITKDELFNLAHTTLGISRDCCKDHFSTAEHPINYIACKNDHFHVPVFSRVLIRDVRSLEPVPMGTPGVLNLITPLLSSVPYGSILTDDIAVLHEGSSCGCGLRSPYFTLAGRVGMIKTCTQTAADLASGAGGGAESGGLR